MGSAIGPEFADRFWGQKNCHVQRAMPDDFSSLFSFEDLDRLIGYSASNDGIKFFKDGDWSEPEIMRGRNRTSLPKFYDLFAKGYGILIRQMEQRWRPIVELAGEMNQAFGLATEFDLFAALGDCGAGSFPLGSETFILQIKGGSTWIEKDDRQNIHQKKSAKKSNLARDPYLEFNVNAGDTLYLTEESERRVRFPAGPCLLLIARVEGISWEDFFVRAVISASQKDRRLRLSLPFGTLLDPNQKGRIVGNCQSFFSEIARDLNPESEYSALSFEQKEKMSPVPDGHFIQINQVDGIDGETLVEKRPGAVAEMKLGDNLAELQFPGDYLFGPEKLFLAMDFVKDTDAFKVKDIPGWYTDREKVLFVRHLVRKGYLRLRERG